MKLTPISFYIIAENTFRRNTYSICEIKVGSDGIPGEGKAYGFLKILSERLSNRTFDYTTINPLTVVTIIQEKVEKRLFYKFLSWIPFTNAYSVAKLITSIKKHLDDNTLIGSSGSPCYASNWR